MEQIANRRGWALGLVLVCALLSYHNVCGATCKLLGGVLCFHFGVSSSGVSWGALFPDGVRKSTIWGDFPARHGHSRSHLAPISVSVSECGAKTTAPHPRAAFPRTIHRNEYPPTVPDSAFSFPPRGALFSESVHKSVQKPDPLPALKMRNRGD